MYNGWTPTIPEHIRIANEIEFCKAHNETGFYNQRIAELEQRRAPQIVGGLILPSSSWRVNAKTTYTRKGEYWYCGATVLSDGQIARMYDKWLNPQRSDRGDYIKNGDVYWRGDLP